MLGKLTIIKELDIAACVADSVAICFDSISDKAEENGLEAEMSDILKRVASRLAELADMN